MENPNFLKQKYWEKEKFKKAAEKSAKKKARLRQGSGGQERPEKDFSASQKPEEQIPAYIERIKRIAEKKGELFREVSLYPKFIIKPENISDDYIKNIILGNFAEMKGYDREKLKMPEIKENILKMFEEETNTNFESYQVPQEQKDQITEQTIKDQKTSLDRWFEYLNSPEAKNYPDTFKYWSFAEMLKLGAQDRDRKTFNKRTESTAAPFPELNQQALALSLDEMQRKYEKEPSRVKIEDQEKQEEFKKRLKKENFAKLYGYLLDHVNSLKLPEERLPITEGEWKKFAKNSNPKKLADSLQGFNTGWCIAGEGTAESYLNHSDVLIYFSEDEEGNNSIPRSAIVTDGSKITEVRGIIQTKEVKQHLDDYIAPVVDDKLKDLPGGESWQDQMEDMKKLAEIHFKHIQKDPLTKDDLVFLYELDRQIQGTGYGKDPRIEKIRDTRNLIEDASIVLECEPNQIANTPEDISKNTKAYIGKLEPGIFETIEQHNIEHIYTKFPEGKIEQIETEIGGKSEQEILSELEAREQLKEDDKDKIYIPNYTKDMLKHDDFVKSLYKNPDDSKEKWELKNKEQIKFVKLRVEDLGFPEGATTDEIYKRAEELGLELCPPETGPQMRFHYEDIFNREQSKGKSFNIGMKQIIDPDGSPRVFRVRRYSDGKSWLNDAWAKPDYRWGPVSGFVFRPRKLKS